MEELQAERRIAEDKLKDSEVLKYEAGFPLTANHLQVRIKWGQRENAGIGKGARFS